MPIRVSVKVSEGEQANLLYPQSRVGVVYGEDDKQYVVKMGRTCAINHSPLEVTGFYFVSNQLNFLYEWI